MMVSQCSDRNSEDTTLLIFANILLADVFKSLLEFWDLQIFPNLDHTYQALGLGDSCSRT